MPTTRPSGATGASSRSPAQRRPRYCPPGRVRCSVCNRLMAVPEQLGPYACDRCSNETDSDVRRAVRLTESVPVYRAYDGTLTTDAKKAFPSLRGKGRPPKAVVRGDGKKFVSITEASIATIGDTSGMGFISSVCKGKRPTAYGFTWRYLDE